MLSIGIQRRPDLRTLHSIRGLRVNRKSFLWESWGNVRLNRAVQVCVEGGHNEVRYPGEVCRLLGEVEICCLRELSLAQAGSVRLESVYSSGASQLEYGSFCAYLFTRLTNYNKS